MPYGAPFATEERQGADASTWVEAETGLMITPSKDHSTQAEQEEAAVTTCSHDRLRDADQRPEA